MTRKGERCCCRSCEFAEGCEERMTTPEERVCRAMCIRLCALVQDFSVKGDVEKNRVINDVLDGWIIRAIYYL